MTMLVCLDQSERVMCLNSLDRIINIHQFLEFLLAFRIAEMAEGWFDLFTFQSVEVSHSLALSNTTI